MMMMMIGMVTFVGDCYKKHPPKKRAPLCPFYDFKKHTRTNRENKRFKRERFKSGAWIGKKPPIRNGHNVRLVK